MNIVGLCGSLRQASINMAALRACHELLPSGMGLEILPLADIPMYNQDVFVKGVPPEVQMLRDKVRAADGVLIATAEYNFSLPAVLKNAIDWCSRPPQQSFQDKPVAIFSASPGPLGGARVQYDLRRVLQPLMAHVLPRPEVLIGNAASKFAPDGTLTDETTRKFLSELLLGLQTWIPRVRPPTI